MFHSLRIDNKVSGFRNLFCHTDKLRDYNYKERYKNVQSNGEEAERKL